jgi:replication factor A1
MDKNNILSIYRIREYYDLEEGSELACNDLVQIVKLEEKKSKAENVVYVASLSDSKHQYPYFLIPKKLELNLYNIIQIRKIQCTKKKVFFITDYNIYEKRDNIIGEPNDLLPIQSSNNSNKNAENSNGNNSKPNDYSAVKQKNGEKNKENTTNGHVSNSDMSSNIKVNNKVHQIFKARTDINHTTIKYLNSFSKDVCLLVRCIAKHEFKNFTNEKGPGKLFNFVVIDKDGTELQICSFNKVADKFFHLIKEGSVYEIEGGFVKQNLGKFNLTKTDIQLVLNESSLIKEVYDESVIPNANQELVKIKSIESEKLHNSIDCIGYVVEVGEKTQVKTRNGEMFVRKVYLVDDSEYKVELALWKKSAEKEYKVGDILLVKNGTISEFQGRNISASDQTRIIQNPTIKESSTLLKWALNFTGQYKTFEPKKAKEAATGEKEDNFDKINVYNLDQANQMFDKGTLYEKNNSCYTVKANVSYINHSEKNFYAGCPIKTCKKKLNETEKNFHCSTCKMDFELPAYYMTLSMKIRDCTKEHWVDLFGSTAEQFLNISAEEYRELVVNNNKHKLNELTSRIEYQSYYFQIRIKMSTYNDVLKKKINVFKTCKIDPAFDFGRMFNSICKVLSISNLSIDMKEKRKPIIVENEDHNKTKSANKSDTSEDNTNKNNIHQEKNNDDNDSLNIND